MRISDWSSDVCSSDLDEIFDRVVGKEALELAIKLRGEDLVGRQDQRRALQRLDHLGHREGLARSGDAEQHLVAFTGQRRLDPFRDRRRLVARRPIGRASCRARVCQYASTSVVRVSLKTQQINSHAMYS